MRGSWVGATAGAALVAAVVAGVLGATAYVGQDDETPRDEPPASATSRELAACREGNQSLLVNRLLFEPGTPRVVTRVENDLRTSLLLEAADGASWGVCSVLRVPDGATRAWVEANEADPDAVDEAVGVPEFDENANHGCPFREDVVTPGCTRFAYRWAERLPDAVAFVEITTVDGVTTRVSSVDGWFLLDRVGEVPRHLREYDDDPLPPLLRRVVYLDADGRPIAGKAVDGSGRGPEGTQLDDLPPLTTYRPLRGEHHA